MLHKIYYSKGMKFFGERAEKILGFEKYDPIKDLYMPVLFSGLYFPEDYEVFKNHQGKKAIFWNGSDVQILAQNLHYQNIIRSFPKITHACHNSRLQSELFQLDILTDVRPIFFGNIDDYHVSYEQKANPEVYMIAHPGREKEYGVDEVKEIAQRLPNIKFHIYGIRGKNTNNIIFHGQVPEIQMDQEIKNFQSCLRLNQHDGFSQTVMKSLLLGQYPITKIPYEETYWAETWLDLDFQLKKLETLKTPNFENRKKIIDRLNNFDWLEKQTDGISLVMIVKNEEKGLEKAILSCKDFVDEIVISVDTASTDLTYSIAKKYADVLLQHLWENDFSKARNFVQEHATKKWVLILDGHEYVEEHSKLDEMLKLDPEGFFTRTKLEAGFELYQPRIFKSWVKWVNPVHNYPAFKKSRKYKEFVVVHDRPHGQTKESSDSRFLQRAKMNFAELKKRVKENKKDMRSHFYLGQQYISAGEWKNAIKSYKKYLKYSKNKQERWLAFYEMSRCADCLNKPNIAIKFLKSANKEMRNRWEISKHIGTSYMSAGKWKKALPYLVNSFTINNADFIFSPEQRNDAQTWYFIGECFFNIKEDKKAEISMNRASEIDSNSETEKLPEAEKKIISALLHKNSCSIS